jgi:cell filamentation protein
MYYGYVKRTGKRNDYKYWYVEKNSAKYYEGLKPSDYVIRIFPRETDHPQSSQIMSSPWGNLETGNHELIESASGVLYNKGGIIEKKEIDSFENFHFIALIHELVHEITSQTRLSVAIINQWHQRFMGQLYSWAGNYRTVDVSKYGFRWPSYNQIDRAMRDFERDYLNNTPIVSNDESEIISFVAHVIGEILFIHPFREGNGRIAKLVGAILLFQKDYPLFDFTSVDKDDWINASLDAYSKNYGSLKYLLMRALNIS